MGSVDKELLGFQDVAFHDPATPGGAQNFSRTSSTGGFNSIRKISAQDLTMRDVPRTAGGRTPLEQLADDAANKNVELAIAEIARSKPDYLNFEANGGIPGTGVLDTQAAINDTVFTNLVTELGQSRYKGIFFPNIFEFATSRVLTGVSNIVLTGLPNAGMRAHSTFSTTGKLLRFIDCSSVRIHEMNADHVSTAAGGSASVAFEASAGNIGNILLSRLFTTEATTAVEINTTGSARDASNIWVLDSTLGADGSPLAVANFSRCNVGGCVMVSDSGGTDVSFTSTGGSRPLSGLRFYDNFVGAGGASNLGVLVNRTGTFDGALHKDIVVSRAQVSNGLIQLNGVNEFTTNENQLFNGRILVNLDMATANNIAFIRDKINAGAASASSCIHITGSGTTLLGFEIAGGYFYNADHNGVRIAMATGVARYGRIHDNWIIDCSRENGGTDYSGILLEDGAAKGVQYTGIHHNTIISQVAPKHRYGIEQQGNVTCGLNHSSNNIIRGWVTAAVLMGGTSVNANNQDFGTAVAP